MAPLAELLLPLAPLRSVTLPGEVAVDWETAPPTASPLARWGAAVAGASDPCLVVDAGGLVVSISAACAELLGVDSVLGRPLLDVLRLVDFETGAPAPEYARRIPPLLVLGGTTLLRGLLRLDRAGERVTVDVVSAPLRGGDGQVRGSLSFLSGVSPA